MRSWIITGCSTGIGRAIATHVLAIGDRAAVTARRPSDVADIVAAYPDRAIALPLDVADPAQVTAAVTQAEARFGAIDVLVNNAGYGYVASIEEGDEAEIKAMYEVNLFGALRMMRAVLPGMRARRQGRIIQISSLAGRISNPATGHYSGSKFALEAVSEALSREVEELGIRVCSIAAGMFRTDFSGRSLRTGDSALADYDAGVHERMKLVQSVDGRQPGDPAKLARIVAAVADMRDPPRQLIAGPDAYRAIGARMDEIRAAMAEHEALSLDTSFDG
ncbi:SDR family NAD(P)-dependent oxidoreductase [Sphingomonas histidinilytica]|uniref:NADP-dependent 3-hydroxy acid dehydrogenase YdfG n=2 Tax=Rhizorhabdus histidinilytica TaxID=439228 RepID=A0A1T5DYX3_9SPHN|nr:SDR family NAD(P)-dependent oxidoreductase [Rhizorhabdus histidinilytica]SKB77002.1 NADP-dependent 3-hydroxy acid dehydrogenase YdfG [Rhizorhabdus histidinilytica]